MEDEGSGFVRADSAAEALRLVGHPETNVYPCSDGVEVPERVRVWFLGRGVMRGEADQRPAAAPMATEAGPVAHPNTTETVQTSPNATS